MAGPLNCFVFYLDWCYDPINSHSIFYLTDRRSSFGSLTYSLLCLSFKGDFTFPSVPFIYILVYIYIKYI